MISLVIDGVVATITLCRPPVNAINEEWIDKLNLSLDEIEAADTVIVIWIRSNQRIFCAGADLGLMAARFDSARGRDLMIAFVRRLQRVYARIEAMTAVSIAEIGGAAMGGGLELALACDLRVIADTARVGLPEVQLGLLPGAGGTQRMTRVCGDAIARRLILGAETIDGKAALDLRLAHWSPSDAETGDFTRKLVDRIAALPAPALAACKQCIAAANGNGENGFELELAGTRTLLADDETQALVRQFLKR